MPVVTIYTPSEARTTILRRVQWEDQEMPASVLDGIERIFGARIAPAEAVARILRDVRARAMRRCTSGRSGSTGGRPARWKCRPWRGAWRTSVCPRNSGRRWIWLPNASRPFTGSSRWPRGWTRGRTARWGN